VVLPELPSFSIVYVDPPVNFSDVRSWESGSIAPGFYGATMSLVDLCYYLLGLGTMVVVRVPEDFFIGRLLGFPGIQTVLNERTAGQREPYRILYLYGPGYGRKVEIYLPVRDSSWKFVVQRIARKYCSHACRELCGRLCSENLEVVFFGGERCTHQGCDCQIELRGKGMLEGFIYRTCGQDALEQRVLRAVRAIIQWNFMGCPRVQCQMVESVPVALGSVLSRHLTCGLCGIVFSEGISQLGLNPRCSKCSTVRISEDGGLDFQRFVRRSDFLKHTSVANLVRGRNMKRNWIFRYSQEEHDHGDDCGCTVTLVSRNPSFFGVTFFSSVGTLSEKFYELARQVNIWFEEKEGSECEPLSTYSSSSSQGAVFLQVSRRGREYTFEVSIAWTVRQLQSLLADTLRREGLMVTEDKVRFVVGELMLKEDRFLLEYDLKARWRYVFKNGTRWEE